jgi:hypothetical protein
MDTICTKPRLVFFQYKYDERLPDFLLMHKREHVKCLSTFFDLTLITGDCDYRQVCDIHTPDLTLFESGVKDYPTHQRPNITNLGAHPTIPKLGLHRQDSFCRARAGFLSDMDHWGIGTFFAIAATAAEHMPEIADSLFVWPNFVDATIYRDYGESKNIPVLFVGNTSSLYPWRQRILKAVTTYYPSLVCPHPGYEPGSRIPQILIGERYARTINASLVAPACGTVVREVVRKHFEVPACNTCLITERSPAVEAAGFVDMTNCVFADEHDVLDKLAFLFTHPDELSRITKAGHDLVHSRHTLAHRDQVLQWFNLHQTRRPDQKIVQLGPFEPLVLVHHSSGIGNSHITSHGLHLALLREGDTRLWAGKYGDAERLYLKCLHYLPFMPEPKLRLALVSLYKGDAKTALSWIEEPLSFILSEYKAVDPDPVEWAYSIICLLCLGKVGDAGRRGSQFPWLRHPELDRARWVAGALKNGAVAAALPSDHESRRRCSVHQLPARSVKEWIEQLCIMLKACGQRETAEAMTRFPYPGEHCHERQVDSEVTRPTSGQQLHGQGRRMSSPQTVSVFRPTLFSPTLVSRVRGGLAHGLHRLEATYGYFLPYRFSEARNDDFFGVVQNLARTHGIDTALILGAARRGGSTEALLAGARENPRRPSVFCIGGSRDRFPSPNRVLPDDPVVKWYEPPPRSSHDLPEALESLISTIKKENHILAFDVILIADSYLLQSAVSVTSIVKAALHAARFILLDGTITANSYSLYKTLLGNPTYAIAAQDPDLRDGYAIFERVDLCEGAGLGACHI